MSKLALVGGEPVHKGHWPDWPIHDHTERQRLIDALTSGQWCDNGVMESEFTRQFAAYNEAGYCLTTNSGSSSLLIALEALDIGVGDEVIVPGLTWTATATVVVEANAVPILVDVEPDTYCLDMDLVEAAITDRTRAIIPVHLYGCMVDMDRLLAISRQYGIAIIEDASHVHGARWGETAAGAMGEIGAFSMQQGKVMTCGHGGAAITNDHHLAEKMDALRTNGRFRRGCRVIEDSTTMGSNYRLTEFQAALLLSQLERLDEQNNYRELSARYLDEQLSQLPGIQVMRRRPQVERQTYYYYVVRYDEASFANLPVELFRQALSAELGFTVAEPYRPLNDNPLFRPQTKKRFRLSRAHVESLDPGRFDLPVAARAFNCEAVLFHHSLLLASRNDLQDVVRAFEKLSVLAADLYRTGVSSD